jgi:peptidoglycan/LPS O-acetylase OafA/YrhL
MYADHGVLNLSLLPRDIVAPELISLGCFLLLRGMLTAEHAGTAVSFAVLDVLGRMSYSVYLWHVMERDTFLPTLSDYTPLRLQLYFVVLFAVSALTYRIVEFRHETDWRKLFLLANPDRLRRSSR